MPRVLLVVPRDEVHARSGWKLMESMEDLLLAD
jgi:hypothetical protein